MNFLLSALHWTWGQQLRMFTLLSIKIFSSRSWENIMLFAFSRHNLCHIASHFGQVIAKEGGFFLGLLSFAFWESQLIWRSGSLCSCLCFSNLCFFLCRYWPSNVLLCIMLCCLWFSSVLTSCIYWAKLEENLIYIKNKVLLNFSHKT